MIAFLSDIHGNFAALQAVLAYLDAHDITEVYSIGDVAGYYPQINECCMALEERNIPNLMGNHDRYLVEHISCGRSRSVDFAIDYQHEHIQPEHLMWLSASLPELRTDRFYACHGGPLDLEDQYLREPPYALDAATGLFVSGHTHVPVLYEEGSLRYLNPGSVGQPRDGDPRASFATLSKDGQLEVHRLSYDIQATIQACQEAGYPQRMWECLLDGLPIGAKSS